MWTTVIEMTYMVDGIMDLTLLDTGNPSLVRKIQVVVVVGKRIHTVEIDIVKLVVEIKSFGMSFDEFDKETGSSDGLQPMQADLRCVHALNEPHLHEIHVVPSKHKADQYVHVIE
ncbi:hypothetical protein Tco_1052454 [Tanacetum coccineum]